MGKNRKPLRVEVTRIHLRAFLLCTGFGDVVRRAWVASGYMYAPVEFGNVDGAWGVHGATGVTVMPRITGDAVL